MQGRTRSLVILPPLILLAIALPCLLAAPVHDALLDVGVLRDGPDSAEYDKVFLQVLRRLLLVGLGAVFLGWFRPWRNGMLRFGLRPTRARLRGAAIAFAVTTGVLLAVLAWQFLAGWLTWEEPLRFGKFGGRVLRYAFVGLLIGVVEEWFFRGWLGEFAVRRHGPRLAVFLPALAYAIVHAFRPTVLDQPVTHDAAGALDALLGWLAFLFDVPAFGPAFVGLLLFAYLLTALYRRSGSLWPSIGVHAAGILVLFSYGALTTREPARTWAGTRLLYDGPVVWAILGFAAWWFWPRDAGGDAEDPGAASGARAG